VPRSLSKSQIDKLGERLAAAPVASEEDLAQLQALRNGDYAAARDTVMAVLLSLGVLPGEELTARLKTNATIIDKLRRGTKLSSMQDVAGARVMRRMLLTEQDQMVAAVAKRFTGPHGESPKIVDRRATPSFGYRAVHVVVRSNGCPVEIQVRTFLQHLWAQIFEDMADLPAFGRGVRYGEPPASARAEWLIEQMQAQSATISQAETMAAKVPLLPPDLATYYEQELIDLARRTTVILKSVWELARSLRP
jgi:ppGpp synthetase/RelA/SpoT-type nucleotidyltranferase